MRFNREALLQTAETIDTRPQFIIDSRQIPVTDDQTLLRGQGETALLYPELTFRLLGAPDDPELFRTVDDLATDSWDVVFHKERALEIAFTESRGAHLVMDVGTIAVSFLWLSRMVFRQGLDQGVTYDQGTLRSIQKAVEYINGKAAEGGGGKVHRDQHRVLSQQMWLRHNWLWSEQQWRRGIQPPYGSGEVILLPN